MLPSCTLYRFTGRPKACLWSLSSIFDRRTGRNARPQPVLSLERSCPDGVRGRGDNPSYRSSMPTILQVRFPPPDSSCHDCLLASQDVCRCIVAADGCLCLIVAQTAVSVRWRTLRTQWPVSVLGITAKKASYSTQYHPIPASIGQYPVLQYQYHSNSKNCVIQQH